MATDHYMPTESFVRLLTEHQGRLYAFVLAISGDAAAVNDILQNTNVTLWRKAADYAEGTSFWAWASRVAHYEVLAHRKRCRRDRHVFDNALLDDIVVEIAQQLESLDADRIALHQCIEKLSESDRGLICDRYSAGHTVQRLAALRGKSAGAVSQSLYRIRGQLADCVEREKLRLRGGGHG